MPRTPTPPEPPDISRPGRRAYRTPRTTEERSEQARAAVLARWSRVADTRAAMLTTQEAANARFYAEPDRLGITDPEVREAMARRARLAHMASMRAAGLKAKRLRAAGIDPPPVDPGQVRPARHPRRDPAAEPADGRARTAKARPMTTVPPAPVNPAEPQVSAPRRRAGGR